MPSLGGLCTGLALGLGSVGHAVRLGDWGAALPLDDALHPTAAASAPATRKIGIADRRGAPRGVREIQAGSGYWSMDSTIPVFPRPDGETTLEVRWPGGETVSYPVPAGSLEVVVSQESGLRVTSASSR